MNNDEKKTVLEFPCNFMIKVLGKNNDEFENTVLLIVRKHFPSFGNGNLQKKLSKDENYLSLTLNIYALNQEQLDAVYQDLSKDPAVLMAL